jgi:hypothetical protein
VRAGDDRLLDDALRPDDDVLQLEDDVGERGQELRVEARGAVVPVPGDVVGVDRVDAVLGQRREQALDRAVVLRLRVLLPELADLVHLRRVGRHPHQLQHVLLGNRQRGLLVQ